MQTEQELWQIAEAFQNDSLDQYERENLMLKLGSNPAFKASFEEKIALLQGLDSFGKQYRFRKMLDRINVEQQNASNSKPKIIRFLQPRYLKMAAVAAGVALLTSVTTVYTLRQNLDTRRSVTKGIQYLERKLKVVEQSQNVQQQQIDTLKGKVQEDLVNAMAPGNFGGTGFAISNNGYLLTNYHVAEGADSIYIQTKDGKYYKASVVLTDKKVDIAVLKIDNSKFRFGKGELPYQFAQGKVALGSQIYTLGFPQDAIVYSEGYVAAKNGYEGDSMQYRLELPSEMGQSGAPVMDGRGNVIGIITGNDQQANNKTYAISSVAVHKLLKDNPKHKDVVLPKGNNWSKLSREEQVARLEDYTCMVRVFKK